MTKPQAGPTRMSRGVRPTLVDRAFAALGDPGRLAMLDGIALHGLTSPSSLAAHLGWARPRVSQQLKILKEAHLLRRQSRLEIDEVGLASPRDWLWNLSLALSHPLPDLRDPALTYAALSHPIRREILTFCRGTGFVTFRRLEQTLSVGQATVSRQVAALVDSGLLFKAKLPYGLHTVASTETIHSAVKFLDLLLEASDRLDIRRPLETGRGAEISAILS